MHRKILGLCAALVAFGAFAVMPAISSAATLTDTSGGGPTVAVGSKIIGEGTGTTLLTAAGGLTVECNENVLTGTVFKNSNGVVEGTLEDAWFQSNLIAGNTDTECKSSLGNPVVVATNLTNKGAVGATVERQVTGSGTLSTHWCVIGGAEGTDNFEVVGRNCGGVGAGEFRFSLNFTGAFTCGFKRTKAIPGTFNTSNAHTAVAELKMTSPQEFVTDGGITGHSIFCPANGQLSNFVFDLYTDTNTTPTNGIHTTPIIKTDPMYISSP